MSIADIFHFIVNFNLLPLLGFAGVITVIVLVFAAFGVNPYR